MVIAATGRRRAYNVIPGFGLSLGLTVVALTCVILVPLAAVALATSGIGLAQFWDLATGPRALNSYKVTFGGALIAATLDAGIGLLVAWVLVRYEFALRRLLDLCIDIPFALPTAVAGITLATLYNDKGWVGPLLASHGIHVAFTPIGIIVAMTFVGLPFSVRTVSSVLEEMPPEFDEAAQTLGSRKLATFFRVTLPLLTPAILTGFAMSLARGIGEYGSVIFIAGNIPNKTEITAFLIITRLEEYDYQGATALAVVMLLASFALIFVVNALQGKMKWKQT